ncbi:hypothetical protein CERSUDRAFT_113556 [Gelatoporia subvermispora B]|uniref:DUF4211 domain-containing protein n=1 Tax=Ceriporiopsis subvermispora (strain B) TaxID=914234 RepID=M2RIW2_CERS8|nr:hypothetical protein CERSUDRAFT_113556 [Gelatoporia subvermispora B]
MAPKKKQATTIPTKHKQKSLDSFVASSSPAAAGPSRPATVTRLRHGKQARDPFPKRPVVSSNDEESATSNVAAIHFEPEAIDTSEEEPPIRKQPAARSRRTKSRRARIASDDQRTSAASCAESEESPIARPSLRASGKRKPLIHDSEEEELQPKRRKLLKGVRPPTPEDDDGNLLDGVDEDQIIEARFRIRGKTTLYQQNLEKLRRKKRGERSPSPQPDPDSEEIDESAPFAHARPNHASPSDNSEPDEDREAANDSFIVEDDSVVVPELPAEFSMNTHQDLMHHFKVICQLFLHLAVQQPGDRDDAMDELLNNQYFAVPLQVTRRKLDGMKDSLVASSVWRQDFKRSLARYPEFELMQLDFTIPGCDACHLGSRLSTLQGRLSGSPYDRTSFQPLDESDESDSGNEDDDDSHGSKREFHLGRFCGMRTKVFHKFTHWEYHLFKTLSLEVEDLRARMESRGFVRVAHAKGKRPPDDLSDADGIMDWLDDRGIINNEWLNMKQMMDSASNLEMRAKKGEDLDDML